MIKANELRIGNRIGNRNNFEMYVTGIFENEVYLNFEGNEGDVFELKAEDLKPIPLTAEWLLKFNLRQGHDWLLNTPNGLCSIPCGEDSLLFDLDSGLHFEKEICNGCFYLSLTKIKYVHQLQNLYFALTGEELKLK